MSTSSVATKRINALKNLQLQIVEAEKKLNDEVSQLECKHSAVFDTLYAKREKIINGEYEPSDEEAKWEYKSSGSDETEQNGGGEQSKKLKAAMAAASSMSSSSDERGLPGFWLKVIESANATKIMVHEHDRPIMAFLRDVRTKMSLEKPTAFTIEFHFDENEFFKNRVLTKSFEFAEEKGANPLLSNHSSLYKVMNA